LEWHLLNQPKKLITKEIIMTKWSLGYEILRAFIGIFFRYFYKEISSTGNSNIPNGKPIIFAANHQNALMDPLGILFTNPNQSVFLTRADIFDNPILLKIFSSFKMLPVYRIKDGADSLKNNERIFNKSVEILEAKMSVALFPEASHTDKRHLKTLKKAVPRIAFMAEEKNDFNLDLQIVPVGIYYEDYVHTNSRLFVNYGKPLNLKPFKEMAAENKQKAYIAFKNKLEDAIKELIIHIKDMNNYELYEGIRLFYRPLMRKKLGIDTDNNLNNFKADRETTDKLFEHYENSNDSINDLITLYSKFNSSCKKMSIRPLFFIKKSSFNIISRILMFIIGLPIFIYGFINNILLYLLFSTLINKIQDKQFHSSVKFAISFTILPILYFIQSWIFYTFISNGNWTIIYLFSLPISAYFANKYRYYWIDYMQDYRFWVNSIRESKAFQEYDNSKNSLIQYLDKIYK